MVAGRTRARISSLAEFCARPIAVWAARLILSGVLTGFLLYFFTDVTHALGVSGIVPVALAAWAPATTALLLGMASLFNQEDG